MMKRTFMIIAVGLIILRAFPVNAEVLSRSGEVPVPGNCAAPMTETMEGCILCHTPDGAQEGPLMMESFLSATADTMTYKTIISEDSKIYAQIPSKTVEQGRSFHIQNWMDGFAMTYDFTITDPSGVVRFSDNKWPWGVPNPTYNYDHEINIAGKWRFKVKIIYCSSGSPVCSHGWIYSELEWTVTVGSDYCTIPSIPYFAQGDSRWGDDEYALPIPQNSFRTWGCAVTSSSMVLRRFGVNYGADGQLVYPGTMNAWLASHQGYTESEILKWWVIDDYSREAPGGTDQPQRVLYIMNAGKNISGEGCVYAGSTGDLCATYSRTISDYICGGIPVILRLTSLDTGRTHFAVAQNQGAVGETRTLEILDPSRPDDNSRLDLVAYSNRFTGYRIFEAATETTDPTAIVVYLGSPAHLQITDPQGNLTGLNPSTGEVTLGIPDSNYLDEGLDGSEFWVGYVSHPVDGAYGIKVVGTATGEFTLGLETYDQSGTRIAREYVGEISAGREYDYSLSYDPLAGSPGGIAFDTYEFSGFAPPLDSDQLRIFKLNRTVPIKFTVRRCDGGNHSDVVARLSLRLTDDSRPAGEILEPDSAGAANTDSLFRFDPVEDQYIYNLDTSDMVMGTWKATVHFDDGSDRSLYFGLR